jgi:AcrR family transcriptional regulator
VPRLLDTADRADAVAAAVARIIAARGVAALTVRAIGAEAGISPASLLQHLGSKQHVLQVSAHLWVGAWAQQRASRSWAEGTAAFLPAIEDDLHDARVWCGLHEIGRTHTGVGRTLCRDAQVERALLDRVTGEVLTGDGLDALLAVVHGLRLAVCAAELPMTLGRAVALLERQATRRVTSAS